MLCEGSFPWRSAAWGTSSPPRVGDGFIRLDAAGNVVYASPNAQSVLRRLGLATTVTGQQLAVLGVRLSRRPGPVDESIGLVLGGRIAGSTEIDNSSAAMTATSVPLRRGSESTGAIVLVRDVTELRRRDRALMTKEASIREIHHRVKNNLQTVAALLRLQARRVDAPEARSALQEAVRRVGAVAVVHDMLAQEPGDEIDVDEVVARVIGLERDLAPAHAVAGVVPDVIGEGDVGALPVETAVPLAMALSEVLHNAIEHAAASSVRVRCGRTASAVEIVVADDGSGSAGSIEPGLGLQIVRTLVEDELGGSVTIGDAEHGGVTATLRVPVRQ
jgi:two-component sensor histidine kinase